MDRRHAWVASPTYTISDKKKRPKGAFVHMTG